MAINAESSGTSYKLIEAGVYPARCYSMIELGTQTIEYMGKEKKMRQVHITWELPTELEVFKEERGLEPFVISKTYALSMFEKAKLRQDLESWRGQGFTDEEAKRFDITQLLGKPCQISIIHKKSTDGLKTYPNISSITRVMKGLEVPEQINPTRLLSFDNWNQELFDTLPEWIREKIQKSPEYQSIGSPEIKHDDVETDDLPFVWILPLIGGGLIGLLSSFPQIIS